MSAPPRSVPAPPRLAELPMLDGLRAVAALAVLLTHVGYQTGEVVRSSGGAVLARFDAGVAVFFVLSGFLLYRPHAAVLRSAALGVAAPPPSVRRYAVRRAARILPAYWVALAFVALAEPTATARRVLTHAWLGQTYTGSLFATFTQTWSLCAELAFYALLPALAAAVRRCGPAREGWALAALALLGYGYVIVVRAAGLPDRALLWLPGHLDWFAVGMGLAVVWARVALPSASVVPAATMPVRAAPGGGAPVRGLVWLARWPGSCWALAGVLLWLVATPVAGPLTLDPIPGVASLVKEIAYAAIGGLLLLPAALGDAAWGGLAGLLAHPVSRWFGRISYGVFLWHLLVLHQVYELTGWQPFTGHLVAVLLLTVLGSVAVAALSWVLVERPVLALAHRRPAARAADPAAAPPRPARPR
jgi:peptidoglycan/LPS O-acetylase OafA/YrhL